MSTQRQRTIYDCPDCNNDQAIELHQQENKVELDEDAEPEEFIPRNPVDVLAVWCPYCDQVIHGEEVDDQNEH